MKKEYVKPQILFCSFELSQDISAGCDFLTNYAQYECAIYLNEEGWELTLYSTEACEYTPPNVSAGDKPCYHAPYDNINVYTS